MDNDVCFKAVVDEVRSHCNADRLEIAIIGGWQTVVGKGQFKKGDTCVYVNPNSVLPKDMSDELGITTYLHNQRIRPCKLRGEKSYGLVLTNEFIKYHNININGDIAKQLGIIKYELPENPDPGHKVRKGSWISEFVNDYRYVFCNKKGWLTRLLTIMSRRFFNPRRYNQYFHEYTHILNYRNNKKVMYGYNGNVVITEKIHGTNFRCGWVSGKWLVGSHHVIKGHSPGCIYWKGSELFRLKDILMEVANDYFPKAKHILLFGEIFGKGIQKLDYDKVTPAVVFFDLSVDGIYIDWERFKSIMNEYSLPIVPELYMGKWNNDLTKLSEGKSTLTQRHIREGIVIKTINEERHPSIGRMILKYVQDAYLLGDYDGFNH